MEVTTIVQEIQLVLTPAIMVSSSALLLLGFQTKFSNLASRFRSLNQELRDLRKIARREPFQDDRFLNLTDQVQHLFLRATHVKNAILLAYGAILCFLLTSVLIFLNVRCGISLMAPTVLIFLTGLVLELIAAWTMMVEVALAFKIVKLESKS